MDPFSGRGNAPFLAAALGRPAVAVDVQPLAWLFTAAKLQPCLQRSLVLNRLCAVADAVRPRDRLAESRFEAMAWSAEVRGFLKAARRELDWRSSRADRTVMAFVAHHMQDRCPTGLSNRFSPTVAHSPEYAVRWWTKRGFLEPPNTDPLEFLFDRIARRYAFGAPKLASSRCYRGDARDKLSRIARRDVKLLITSPPYRDVTDYWNDQWLRLWILGGPMKKDWRRAQKHANLAEYRSLLAGVFRGTKRHLREDAVVLVRCGGKGSTAQECEEAVRAAWPRKHVHVKTSSVVRRGVASGHAHGEKMIEEQDILAVPSHMKNLAPEWIGSS